MKFLTSASLAVLVFGAGKLLANTSLEGQVFQGAFVTVPAGASDAMTFTHNLQFGADWKVVDNSPTWFGKEATTCNYGLEWKGRDKAQLKGVTIICNGHVSHFKAVQEGDVVQLEGAHVTLAKAN
jgi:hypothetical protein